MPSFYSSDLAALTDDLGRMLQSVTGLSGETIHRLTLSLTVLAVLLLIHWVVGHIIHRRVENVSKQYATRKTTGYVLTFFYLLILFRIWLGGGSAFAYFGILSAGLAIALQDMLANLAGWIFIAIRKPFVIGDRIEIDGIRGDVIDLRPFQFSILEIGNWVDADQSTGRIIHIPNGRVFKSAQANYTQGFDFIWDEMAVMVTFESNWRKAKDILQEIADRHNPVQSEQAVNQVRKAARKYLIFFQKLSPIVWTSVKDSGVVLTLRYLCGPRKRRSTASTIWEDILEAFSKCDDIDFAYPTQRFYDNALEGKPEARASVPRPSRSPENGK